MSPVTPHDIAQLAWTRRTDPPLALRIATEAGKANDARLSPTPITKEAAK